ncbi:MAG: hypothetical protein BMS9Abin28_2599 [Anaerolineae bacterium]|nr:MAG: hypothetical protein BMS9Abin28_2599 [Anaerolineae bacterium]
MLQATAANPLKMNSHPARVLVVDDDDSYCTIIRELLVRNGYEVRVAYSVDEALTLLQDERPDLILTDLMMPEVDGITFIRQLRATPPHSEIPTIVVSALVLARERAAAAQAGADAFVAKPFSINQLQATIQEVVGD